MYIIFGMSSIVFTKLSKRHYRQNLLFGNWFQNQSGYTNYLQLFTRLKAMWNWKCIQFITNWYYSHKPNSFYIIICYIITKPNYQNLQTTKSIVWKQYISLKYEVLNLIRRRGMLRYTYYYTMSALHTTHFYSMATCWLTCLLNLYIR